MWGGRLGPEREVDVLYRSDSGTDIRGHRAQGTVTRSFSIIGYPIFVAASPSAFREHRRFPSGRSGPKGSNDAKRLKVFLLLSTR